MSAKPQNHVFWSAIVKVPSPILSSCDLLSNANQKILLTLALLQVTWAKSFFDGCLKMNKQQALGFKIPHRHKACENNFPPTPPQGCPKTKAVLLKRILYEYFMFQFI